MDGVPDRDKTREQLPVELTALRARLAALESAGQPHDNAVPAGLPRPDLRWSREQLEAILRTAADGITVQGPDGRLLFANEGAARLTGYPSAEAFLAAPLAEVMSRFELFDESGRPLPPAELPGRKALAGEPAPEAVIRFRVRATGEERWSQVRSTPVRDAGGRVAFAVNVFHDITERKRVEEALRESEERFRDLFENANDTIYTLDLQGRITSVNRRAEEVFGYTRQECLGRNAAEIVPPEYHARMHEALARKLAGEPTPTVYELEVVRKDGRRVPLEVSSRLIVRGGRPVGVQGIARDVTERKRAEEALREADRRKDEFLAMLAHELRNPLAPIRNALHILKVAGWDGSQVEQMRAVMERQVQHLARLVDDLLDVSRITRGKIELRKEPVELATVVARAVETARPGIDAQAHELAVSLPPGPVWLEGDLVRLAQVFGNLLNNAAKFTPRAGRIALTAECAGGEVVVRVRDTGVGMAPEVLPAVFELFVQGDHSVDRPQGGLGIGLTLVKRLVEMHGGVVRGFSEGPGKGSEFTVRLPLAPPRGPGRGAREEPAAPSTRARRVLVVDDSEDSAESMAVLLRLGGHRVETAHDGPSALVAARELVPDVVLLDIGMPGMSGHEVARRLRAEPAMAGALLVALTGYGQPEDRRRSREAGFDYHLVKPVDPGELGRLLAGVRGG